MNTAENTPTVTSTAVVETPKSVTTTAPKPLINYGSQGVKLASLEDAFRFANAIVASGFAPRGMEKPEAVLVAIQLGAELGLTPMAALQNTAVINGRPAIYGDAALALVRASGLLESFNEEEVGEAGKDSFGIKVTATRRDGSKGSETFTVADAKAAKLWGKSGPWTDYPRRMLKFRARGFVLRDVFGDVLKGLRTAEEVRDYPEERNITPLSEKVSGGLTMSITQGGGA
jgi:hypothetical protein